MTLSALCGMEPQTHPQGKRQAWHSAPPQLNLTGEGAQAPPAAIAQEAQNPAGHILTQNQLIHGQPGLLPMTKEGKAILSGSGGMDLHLPAYQNMSAALHRLLLSANSCTERQVPKAATAREVQNPAGQILTQNQLIHSQLGLLPTAK